MTGQRLAVPRRLLSKLGIASTLGVGRGSDRKTSSPDGFSDSFADVILPSVPTDPPGPRLMLLNDCRDQDNFGAGVLMDGLLRILSRSVPHATIVPIPSHWLIDASFGFGAFRGGGEGFRQPKANFPMVADQFQTVADDWVEGRGGRDAHKFLTRIEGADLVVLNGEGSIYRDNLSAIRELFLAWLAKTRLGVPTIFVNGTVHLTDVVPVLPAMVRKTFSTLDAVAVREAWSLRNLRTYAPDVNVRAGTRLRFRVDAGRRTRHARGEGRPRAGQRSPLLLLRSRRDANGSSRTAKVGAV